MEQEKAMTSQESLELITRMINRARRDYLNSGLIALLWGSVIPICSLVAFANYLGGIWISFAIAVWLLTFVFGRYPVNGEAAIYLTLYGVPTFATGYTRSFRPMLLGGLACWVLAVVSLYCNYPYTMLCIAAGALLAWFIPGLILRKCYLKAKENHV